jgi:predicted amidohydrolase
VIFLSDVFTLWLCPDSRHSPENEEEVFKEKNALYILPAGTDSSRAEESSASGGGYSLLASGNGAVSVYDDGGSLVNCYFGMHGREKEGDFTVFRHGGFLCGLSSGNDLLFPEHSRILALAGADLICIFPPADVPGEFPLEIFARVRAMENLVYVVLVVPGSFPPLVYGPRGERIGTCRCGESREKEAVLSRANLLKARKMIPLFDLRKKERYHSITVL